MLDTVAAACVHAGVSVMVLGEPGYPPALADDRQAPAVLFCTGDVAVLEGRPRVAVVGTRSATAYGVGVAAELGRDLARSGVVVVSGAALGIDSAAHAGALGVDDGAATIAVLGTALDAPTTRAQSALHDALCRRGAVLSEIPPGVHSARWWFAVRNRVMAALAHVVVVVECHHRGGSLHTVAAALARGVTVAAVPGSVRSLGVGRHQPPAGRGGGARPRRGGRPDRGRARHRDPPRHHAAAPGWPRSPDARAGLGRPPSGPPRSGCGAPSTRTRPRSTPWSVAAGSPWATSRWRSRNWLTPASPSVSGAGGPGRGDDLAVIGPGGPGLQVRVVPVDLGKRVVGPGTDAPVSGPRRGAVAVSRARGETLKDLGGSVDTNSRELAAHGTGG